MEVRVTGVNQFLRKTALQRQRIKQGAGEFTRQQTEKILKLLVLNTPQWSGNTAASWRVETYAVSVGNELTRLYRSDWRQLRGEQKSFIGDPRAWQVAKEDSLIALQSIRYNTRISIVNTAPYAETLATDPSVEDTLRTGNFIPGDVMAVKFAALKYRVDSDVKVVKV